MYGVGLREPHVTINAGALVEPSVPKARIHAQNDVILGPVGEEVREVKVEGCIPVVIAANKAPVHKHQHAAESAIEFDRDAPAEVAGWTLKLAPVPAHTGVWIPPAERLES